MVYRKKRRQPVKYQWPPNQPHTIVNVTLIHHEGEQSQQELIDMSIHNISDLEKLSDHPKVTKKISDIFRHSEDCILIEGAPGIGKTVLAKEIAYCWANSEILVGMKLFLLFIRDPNLHSVKSIKELVHYFSIGYLSTDGEVESATDDLIKSKGSNVVFVIDGYDECPRDSKLKGFIDELLQRTYLPLCMIVITSRPTVSLWLHQSVGQRIEILGLAKKERDQYISESLKGSPEMKIKLQEYLKQQPIISNLLYVPLHLAVLLYLFKQDSLPETLTEMNESFIIHTIYQHLIKQKSSSGVDKISNLPEPELTVVQQLCVLAYNGLQKNHLVFTYDEVMGACPGVDKIPGAINGFGLLQAVEHYRRKGAGTTVSFNFVHFTMQQYLAALHVSTLPDYKRLSLITETLWDEHFRYMWIMYVGVLGSKSTNLLISLSHLLLNMHLNLDIRRRLFLFECYLEIKNFELIPKEIISIFSDGYVDLHLQTLLPHHIMSLTMFMMRSTTEWRSLNLDRCSICCNGISVLAKFFTNFPGKVVTINHVSLRYNNLTSIWGTDADTNQHDTDENIVDNGLFSVQSLDLSNNKLNNSGMTGLFPALNCNKILHKLNLSSNNITDEGAVRLAKAIQVNTTLQELNVSKNWICKEGVMRIMEACTVNRTLHKLVCTHNNLTKSGLAAINEYIRKENAVQIFEASWNSMQDDNGKCTFSIIKVTTELLDTQKGTSVNTDVEWWNDITERKIRCDFMYCCIEEHLNVHEIDLSNTRITSANAMPDLMLNMISDCLKVNKTLIKLNLSNNGISNVEVKYLFEAIMVNTKLKIIDLSKNMICDDGTEKLAEAIQVNTTLQELSISENWISKEGVMRIVEACTKNRTLHKLVCTHNNLSKSGLAAINEYIRKENAIQKFEASWNSIFRKYDKVAIKITFRLLDIQQNLQSGNINVQEELWFINDITDLKHRREFLHCCYDEYLSFQCVNLASMGISNFEVGFISDYLKFKGKVNGLNLSGNKINVEGAKEITKAIQVNKTIQNLNLSHNTISDSGVLAISNCLKTNSTLCDLNLSNNKITAKGANIISETIQVNQTIQSLDISHNTISDDGVLVISDCLQINSALCHLNLCSNEITESGARGIAGAIQVNTTLQSLDMSHNRISDDGVLNISNSLYTNSTLCNLNLSNNKITDKGTMRLAKAIQVNTRLQNLDISKNLISDNGILAISRSLYTNSTLKKLNLSNNKITDPEVLILAEAIQVNTT